MNQGHDTSSKTAPVVPEGVDTAEFWLLVDQYNAAGAGTDWRAAADNIVAYCNGLLAQQREAGRRAGIEQAYSELKPDIKRLRDFVELQRQQLAAETWVWVGDGTDHLESMGNGMAVVIRANQLRALATRQPVASELTDEHPHADLIHELRQFAQAYPEDIFTPLTDAEREGNDIIITKASAGMGRYCAKWFIKAADALESASPASPVSALTDEQINEIAEPFDNYGIDGETGYFDVLGFASALLAASPKVEPNFQRRVQPWMMACFGPAISADARERNHRFFEEAGELVQACGMPKEEAHMLVDYVYGRPVGEKPQEVGGVMVTLAALCLAHGMDMHEAGEVELARIWTKVDAIRAKQAAKPKNSPLPIAVEPVSDDKRDAERRERQSAIAEKVRSAVHQTIGPGFHLRLAALDIASIITEFDADTPPQPQPEKKS